MPTIGTEIATSGSRQANQPAPRVHSLRVTIDAFSPKTQKWQDYQKRLEQSFNVQDLTNDARKKAMLLTSLGRTVCELLWDLFSPNDATEENVTYEDICNVLSNHFTPNKIEVAERFRFYQLPEESVSHYLAILSQLSEDCSFKAFLNEALRDAFIIGLLDQRIQTKL